MHLRGWLERLLGLIAALVLLALMLVTFVDVIGRYFLASPIPGAFELTEFAMALLIFAGLPLVSAREEHVTINLLAERLGPRARALQLGATRLVAAIVLAVIAWRLWLKAGQISAYGDITTYLGIPLGPLAYTASGLCGLSALLNLFSARPSLSLGERE